MTFDVNQLWKSSIDGITPNGDVHYNAIVGYLYKNDLVHWEPKKEYYGYCLRPDLSSTHLCLREP